MLKYRPDVDGLRSIAVMSVIFFHFGIPGFGGGYVGVDVFFVISGYLIGSIILQGLEAGTFSFIDFYLRRIARLYPAYVFVICFTTVAAFIVFLPREFRDFGKSLVASVLYASNILFFREAGYFDASASLKPLLHTWSLSTEEQFYVFFPGFAYLAYRWLYREAFFGLLVSVAVASLLYSAFQIQNDKSAVFYLFQFRAWELLLGVIIATGKLPRASTRILADCEAWTGVGLLLFAIVAFSEQTLFPAISALVPCLGASLIIHSGLGHQPLVNKLLSMRVPVFIGLISYSLYLWHWPLYVFARYWKGTLAPIHTTMLLVSTFALATLTWRIVERPLRLRHTRAGIKNPVAIFSAAVAVSIALGGGGFAIYQLKGMPNRLSSETARMAEAAGDFLQNWNGCVGADNPNFPGLAHCPIGKPYGAESVFIVWGDSHARALKNAVDAGAAASGQSGIFVWAGGCPPLFGVEKHESVSTGRADQACAEQSDRVRLTLQSSPKVKSIILIGRWAYYAEGEGVGVDKHNTIAVRSATRSGNANPDQRAVFSDALLATVKELHVLDKRVAIVQQVPEIPNYNSQRLGISMMQGNLSQDRLKELSLVAYGDVLKRQNVAMRTIASAATLYGAQVLDTHSYFCRKEMCSALLEGAPAYFDNNHITVTTSLKFGTLFSSAMRPK
jgi:peptidoglycan/LPS O-acetylase OafA/YrhL